LNDRFEVLDTISFLRGRHEFKGGIDFNYVDHKKQALPLHFGGRYLFQSLPAIPGILPVPVNGIQALALGLPAAYVQGYGTSGSAYGYRDLSLSIQDAWRVASNVSVKAGLRFQSQYWPDTSYRVAGYPNAYQYPTDHTVGPRVAASWDPAGDKKTSIHAAYGLYYDNLITAIAGITGSINGTANGVRTLVLRFPNTLAGWNAPGHKLPEPTTPYPSLVIALDPGLRTPY